MIINTTKRGEALKLARERGYNHVTLVHGWLIVDGIDYVAEILAPRGLAERGHACPDWSEACRLLGMLPPARNGGQP